MIDTIALALGHALLAVALVRLALRVDVDRDPLIARLAAAAEEARRTRRGGARAKGPAPGDGNPPGGSPEG